MKYKQFFLVAFAVLLSTTALSAEPTRREARRESNYTNGFAVALGGAGASATVPSASIGYFFADNNCMSAFFSISPYFRQNNLYGVSNFDCWTTSIGANVSNYISLARTSLGNKFFFQHGPSWKQVFGKSLQNDLRIQSSWSLGYDVGFQYRLSPQVYFGILTNIGYSQTKFKQNNNTALFNNKQSAVNVLNSPSVYMTFLF